MEIREIASGFKLLPQSGEKDSLKDFADKKAVVLFFYPKDSIPGCPKEACTFRDDHKHFGELEPEVIGISSDYVGSHEQFAESHGLPFTLLSDEEGEGRKPYGVPSTLGLFTDHVTYVIDKEGEVRYVFQSQLGTTPGT